MTLLSLVKIIHIIGLVLGFGGALAADLAILRHAILSPIRQQIIDTVKLLSHVVFVGLALLWASGIVLIYLRASADPHVLMNQKIWAKVIIVCILTVNGIAVHNIALGQLVSRLGHQLFDSANPVRMAGLTFIAAVSSVSWIFPLALGVATELNFKVSAAVVLAMYANFLLIVWCTLLSFVRFITSRNIVLHSPAFLGREAGVQSGVVAATPTLKPVNTDLQKMLHDARFSWLLERRGTAASR